MDQHDSVADLVARWRAGDDQAAAALFTRYAARLSHVAEAHLSRRVAVRENGDDVVQSVFRTFFRRCAAGQFQIAGDGELWRLLVKITTLKARAKGRFHSAEKRDINAEAPGTEDWFAAVAGREPGPIEAAVLVDLIESALRGLPPEHAQVLELRLAGHSRSEIASRLGVSWRTVCRILAGLKAALDRALLDGP